MPAYRSAGNSFASSILSDYAGRSAAWALRDFLLCKAVGHDEQCGFEAQTAAEHAVTFARRVTCRPPNGFVYWRPGQNGLGSAVGSRRISSVLALLYAPVFTCRPNSASDPSFGGLSMRRVLD